MTVENRSAFFDRLASLPASDEMDIQLAYTMAKFAHRSQVRKETGPDGEPLRYFEHVRRVALVLIDDFGITDKRMVITALLHDGIEDTRDLTPQLIEHTWGKEVASWVKTLSKVPVEGYLDRFRRCDDWQPYVIKAADRIDNLRSLGDNPRFREKQLAETAEKYVPLFDRMVEVAPDHVLADRIDVRTAVLDTLLAEQTRTIRKLISQANLP